MLGFSLVKQGRGFLGSGFLFPLLSHDTGDAEFTTAIAAGVVTGYA